MNFWHCRLIGVLSLALCTGTFAATDGALVHHWTFDDASGQAAKDSATGGREAKLHHVELVAGKQGKALAFDGKQGYAEIGDLGEFDAVTIAFWMHAKNVATKEWQGLVSSDAWEKGSIHLTVRKGRIEVYLHRGEKERSFVHSSSLKNNTWVHVALTLDRRANLMRLIINGQEQDSAGLQHMDTKIKLLRQVIGREDKGRYFAGRIDDVRIYARALSEDEVAALCPGMQPLGSKDPRNIRNGLKVPDEGYCDQPYVVITPDGNWLCTMTTGPGHEGHGGQHIVATISKDKGKTWSELIDIEPSTGPEASWVVPLITSFGRVYGFYTYNGDNIRELNGKKIRADMMGWYCYRYSDDYGRTWSKQRYRLPMRVTACDRSNDWQGEVQIFWGIDKPKVARGEAYFMFTKLGKYMLENGEGWMYHSDNVMTERDVSKLRWELLPDGDHGIRVEEFGSTQEEHNHVSLSDGKTLYCVYRTTTGYPCHCYSFDAGHTWTTPVHMTYRPDGQRRVKNPRACPKLWKTSDGRYLFWFHNHSGQGFQGRNPAWILGGVEKDGRIHWSQPEIVIYADDVNMRMSYPDLIEEDGRFWITETNKTVARVHSIDRALLDGLWNQGKVKQVAREGQLLECKGDALAKGKEIALPQPIDLTKTRGLSVDVWLTLNDLKPGQVIVDSRKPDGKGIALTTAEDGTVKVEVSDGTTKASWTCDPGLLEKGKRHHVVATVDDSPKIITFVVDGKLCDGGEHRQYGWGRYAAELGDVSGTGKLRVAPSLDGTLHSLRVYGRYVRTSEAVANYHAGL